MKLSIIIPVLNEAECLEAALKLLQAARDAGHEVIAVDGGSDDNSIDIMHGYVDKIVVSARGRAWQMNAGAKQATGDVLVFLHADTQLTVDFTQLIIQAMHSSDWGFFKLKLSGQHYLFRVIERCINCRSSVSSVATGDQCLFLRGELFAAMQGYTLIPLMEDVDLCERLRKTQRPAIIGDKVIVSSRRWEKRGILRTVLTMWRIRLSWYFGHDPASLARWYD